MIFHHTWIKYWFHRGALESGPQWPLCALHSLPLPELLQPAQPPSDPEGQAGSVPLWGRSLFCSAPLTFQLFFFRSCDMDWSSPLSNHGPLHILSFCTSVFWLCVCSLALAHTCPVFTPFYHLLWQQPLSRYLPSSNFDYLQKHSYLFLDLLSSTTGNVQFSLVYYTLIFNLRNYFSSVDFLRRLIINFCVKSHLPQNGECARPYLCALKLF